MQLRNTVVVVFAGVLGAAIGNPAMASDIETRLDALEQEVQTLREQRAADQVTIQGLRRELDATRASWGETYTEVEALSEEAKAEANFMLSGYGAFNFTDRTSGGMPGDSNDTFRAAHFNPIIQYRMSDRLSWVSELEFEMEGEFETADEFENEPLEIALEYSYLDYVVTDWMTFRAGKFFTPLGIFNERLHPAWINKLPTRPVPYTRPSVLLPMTDVGIMARGGVHVGEPVVNYAIALTNGPFETEDEELGFPGAFTDNNPHKTVSGRLGVIPYPGFEFGIAGMTGPYTHDGNQDFQAIVLDGTVQLFANMLDLRAEYIDTTQERSVESDIDRDGWWVQAAHRLAWLDNEWLMPVEAVVRYGEADSDVFEQDDRDNLTIGLNYYIMNNFIARVAYDWYDGNTKATDSDQFTVQLSYGF